MPKTNLVYVLVLSGDDQDSQSFVEGMFPGVPQILLSKEPLLAAGWRRQLCEFRRFQGQAFVFFADSIAAISEPNLKLASALAHRCRLTVIADSAGDCRVYTRRAILMRLPQFVWSGVLDLITLVLAEIGPRVLSPWLTKQALMPSASDADLDVVVLYPFPFQRLTPGGELSYLRGSLSGFAAAEMSAELVSGCPVPIDTTVHLVPNRRHLFLFKETQALSYNVRFVLGVRRALLGRRPRFVYQRHGRFVLAGAILARLLRAPLVLEYQNSEYWWARTWGSSRFLGLIERLEDMSVRAASVIAVVSAVLRDELVSHGVPEHKIVVTPAAVDPERFRSSGSRERTRQEFGFSSDEIVVGFVGSFSHWHGIHVLERALLRLARSNGQPRRIRFLLVGDGPLKSGMEGALERNGATQAAVFTGMAAADRVPELLDAADILVAPNVQMPEGKSFFGSPSKLFEYMATGKAIVASDLDQLGEVLSDGQTALLFPPDDDERLSAAIEQLAGDEELRNRLGTNARRVVLEQHTWRHNAVRLAETLERIATPAQPHSHASGHSA